MGRRMGGEVKILIFHQELWHFGGKLLVLGLRERSEPAEIFKDFRIFLENRYFPVYGGYELVWKRPKIG